MEEKKDWLGNIVLWAFALCIGGIVLGAMTEVRLFGIIAALGLGVFGLFMAFAVIGRVFEFGCEMKDVWQKNRRKSQGRRR